MERSVVEIAARGTGLRRSKLITPADNWDMILKAARSEADIIHLEIEDGVAAHRKGEARQLCLKANPNTSPTCPSGTNDVNGVCRYGTQDGDECASILLGTDGHIDLGGLLASISPGTKGGLDFLLAAGGPSPRDDSSGFAWGDLNPISGGATLGMIGAMLTGAASTKNLSSVISIAQVANASAQMGLAWFLSFLAIISLSLGILNLLPIPMLDGGHLLYYLVEWVKGSPVSERTMIAGQYVGMAALAALMSMAFYNDILRLVAH